MRRLQYPPLSTTPTPKFNKNFNSKTDNPSSSSPTTMASPNRITPSPVLAGTQFLILLRRHCYLVFLLMLEEGKWERIRILYNRHLQLRFLNATVFNQKHRVEEHLWNAWIRISDLRDSVTKKRHRLKLLRQKLKLASVLKAHMVFLEDWACLDKDHSISLVGAVESLKASTLRLPVGAGATADLQSMKDAISSALHVMQAMGSSMNSICLQVEKVNIMVTEIVSVSAKERALLRICKDLLSLLSALKVKDCSLRTHVLQTRRMK